MAKKVFFLTGASGFLGSYLLKIILQQGHKAYALVRQKKDRDPQKRVIDKLKFWNGGLESNFVNLNILEGDLTQPRLGLSDAACELLSEEVDEIFHIAAITNLNYPLESIRKVNVEGTANIMDLAAEIHKKNKAFKVNHISTAFIYGDYSGVFKEDILDIGQKFKNTYEQTKFEAEKVVEEYRKKGIWINVFRPPIIVGHSQTGKAFRFRNIYQLLHICSLGLFDTLPVSNPYIDIVPIDWVSEAIYLLADKSTQKNKTYHPFPNNPVSIEDIIHCGCKLMQVKSPKLVPLKDFDVVNLTPIEKTILENNIMSLEFKARLSSEVSLAALGKLGFKFPPIDSKIMENILRYFVQENILNIPGGY